ncbi:MAG: hypothetical protein ACLSGK_06850 [Lachnospiraceae bacterium]
MVWTHASALCFVTFAQKIIEYASRITGMLGCGNEHLIGGNGAAVA